MTEVNLFVSCLVDQVWPQAGEATVELLRRAGCSVRFDPRQTCCGQPAFNAGHRTEAQAVGRTVLAVFDVGEDATGEPAPIVVPSGSCAAMLHRLPQLFSAEDEQRAAARIAARTFELSQFLVGQLGVLGVGGRFSGRVAWHDGCHGLRELGVQREPRLLLDAVEGLTRVEFPIPETCCGFGGSFSVKHDDLSVAMADRRLEGVRELDVDAIASTDAGCLLQLEGRLGHRGDSGIRVMHLAEVLVAEEGPR